MIPLVPFLVAVNIVSLIVVAIKFKDFGLGFFHLSSIFFFQTSGAIAYQMGYIRPGLEESPLAATILGRLIIYILFFLSSYIFFRSKPSYLLSLRISLPALSRKSNSCISPIPWLFFLRQSSLVELILYLSLVLLSFKSGSRLDLTQVQKMPYYASLIILMFYLAHGIPAHRLRSVLILFLFPKLFIGFLGWRGSFAWIGTPLLAFSYGTTLFSFISHNLKHLLGLRVSRWLLTTLPLLVISLMVMVVVPSILRGDSWSIGTDSNPVANFLGEIIGSPFWLGFYNSSHNIIESGIFWPLSSFIDIYINPFFHFGSLYDLTPFNMPLRYDRYLTQQILSPDLIELGLGTGGSLSGELASLEFDFSWIIGSLVGLLSAALDTRSFKPTFVMASSSPPVFRFVGLWLASKIFYLPRGTITEVFDMLPVLLILFYLVKTLHTFSSPR
jgi:hypothetical protein